MSGEQRLKSARDGARDNQASLQRDLDARRKGPAQKPSGAASRITTSSSPPPVCIKEEPLSESEDEAMDLSDNAGPGLANGSLNGYPGSPNGSTSDTQNGGHTGGPGPELQDFVRSTFRRHFVLTFSEMKRHLNLHLASQPPGHCPFGTVPDRTLQDAILFCQCRQIVVPVSMLGYMVVVGRLGTVGGNRYIGCTDTHFFRSDPGI